MLDDITRTEVFGEARTYGELLAVLVHRIGALGVPYGSVDDVAGLPGGYTQKLLTGARNFGPMSFDALLATLGVKVVVVVDEVVDFERRIRPRLILRRRNAGGGMLARGEFRRRSHLSPDYFRVLRRRQLLLQSARKRSEIARIAARGRWSRKRTPSLLEGGPSSI